MTDTTGTLVPKSKSPSALSMSRLWPIATIACATMMPIFLVSNLIDDRESREIEVHQTIAKSWGPSQTVWGPTLVVPIHKDGTLTYLKIAPTGLDVTATIAPEQRRRGLFAATVYSATLDISGSFTIPAAARAEGMDRAAAYLALAVSATDGIEASDWGATGGDHAAWQLCGDVIGADPCAGGTIILATIDATKDRSNALPFHATLHLHGSEALKIAVTAKQATIRMAGAWPSPSYVGDVLPAKTGGSGRDFAATWSHDEIGRPRLSTGAHVFDVAPPNATVGVDLIETTPVYRAIVRATKYSPLIIVLSFATYFLFELVSGIRIAALQYALLGASLSLFTLLLLSVSELVGYPAGYLCSALLVVGQATTYTASVGRRARPALAFGSMLAGLFGFLYVLLGLESYALVVGTVAVFIVLSIVMAVTQQIQGMPKAISP